jgi:hypothetical protein
MKSAFLLVLAVGLSAQMRDNRDRQLNCENNHNNNERARSCKMSEQSLPALGRLTVDAGHNGGVSVKGWSQGQTLVRARVEAWAPTDSEASLLAGQVNLETSSGMLRATGPDTRDNRGWAVSWEVFTPHQTSLTLSAHNGGIHVNDIRGTLQAKTHNGGVHLARVAGEVTGSSHNGGIHVEMASNEAGQLNFDTHNGGIHLALPSSYSARVHAETNNGGINSDFPLPETRHGERRPRNIDFTIGGGGPSINVKTNNGGVHIKKI